MGKPRRLLESISTRIYVYQNPHLLESTSTRIYNYQNLRLLESTPTRIYVYYNLPFSTNAVIRLIESYRRPLKTACVYTHAPTTKTPNYLFTSFSIFLFSSLRNVLFLARAIYPQIQIEFISFLRIFPEVSSRPYTAAYQNQYARTLDSDLRNYNVFYKRATHLKNSPKIRKFIL